MGLMRNRAGLIATMALAWHLMAMATVSAVLSCHQGPAQEHAGMENCPLHSKPVCPLHAEKHGTHDCDCPTIGCAQTDAAIAALFGLLGDLPEVATAPVTPEAEDAALSTPSSVNLLAPVPLSPPPRT